MCSATLLLLKNISIPSSVEVIGEYAINTFSPNVIDAILYVPEKADKDYETRGYESFFDKIKTLPNEEKLERHKAKSLTDGLEDIPKKPRLREKRTQKEARQK